MSELGSVGAREFYAQTYDVTVSDWPGEIDFYRQLATDARAKGGKALELACGTGRVAMRLAQDGTEVVGLDVSPPMLDVAREKSRGLSRMRWVQGDMRAFDLGETFALAIIPGHAFQNLVTAADQVTCLECIRRHLAPGGLLVVHLDHLDVSWLGELTGDKAGILEPAGEFVHPKTGRQIRTLCSWSYEPATQTAIARTVWEELGASGEVTERWETGSVRLHCVFRFEMEHLLARTGFVVEALYGDFFGQELRDDHSEMIFFARAHPAGDHAVQPLPEQPHSGSGLAGCGEPQSRKER
jgi:ubiquinone/menaquinone biosynthesis C-methylase UbiE